MSNLLIMRPIVPQVHGVEHLCLRLREELVAPDVYKTSRMVKLFNARTELKITHHVGSYVTSNTRQQRTQVEEHISHTCTGRQAARASSHSKGAGRRRARRAIPPRHCSHAGKGKSLHDIRWS